MGAKRSWTNGKRRETTLGEREKRRETTHVRTGKGAKRPGTKPGDLVVIEGGGNGLLDMGGEATAKVFEDMVKMVKSKVEHSPLVICISMRQGKETSLYRAKRRWVNRRCLEQLEEWVCDGLQLWERMRWRRDGIHMSNMGKTWMAWNVAEWAQHWGDAR